MQKSYMGSFVVWTYYHIRLCLLWCLPLLRFLPFRRRMILRDGAPYMLRIYLTPSTGRLGRWWRSRFRGHVLHKIVASDHWPLHNHPWDESESTILRGCYTETRRGAIGTEGANSRVLVPGDSNKIDRTVYHMIELVS